MLNSKKTKIEQVYEKYEKDKKIAKKEKNKASYFGWKLSSNQLD